MAGMDLDHGCADRVRRFDLARLGIDKERDPDPGLGQPRTEVAQLRKIRGDIQTALGRQLFTTLGDQAAIGRPHSRGDLAHLRGRGHFQIHAGLQDAAEQIDIALLNMATILAQMQRDRIGTGLLGDQGRLDRLRITGAARPTDGGDVIDVDAEQNPGRCLAVQDSQDSNSPETRGSPCEAGSRDS
jgi:hypothetical protein